MPFYFVFASSCCTGSRVFHSPCVDCKRRTYTVSLYGSTFWSSMEGRWVFGGLSVDSRRLNSWIFSIYADMIQQQKMVTSHRYHDVGISAIRLHQVTVCISEPHMLLICFIENRFNMRNLALLTALSNQRSKFQQKRPDARSRAVSWNDDSPKGSSKSTYPSLIPISIWDDQLNNRPPRNRAFHASIILMPYRLRILPAARCKSSLSCL